MYSARAVLGRRARGLDFGLVGAGVIGGPVGVPDGGESLRRDTAATSAVGRIALERATALADSLGSVGLDAGTSDGTEEIGRAHV